MVNCLDIMNEANAGRLSDDDLEDLLLRMQAAREANEAREGVERAVFRESQVIAEESEMAKHIAERNRLQNIIVEGELRNRVQSADDLVGNPALGIKSALVGVNTPILGAQRSVDSLAQGMIQTRFGGMIHDLEAAGVRPQFMNMSGDLERDVARVLENLNTPDAPRIDVSADAKKIGEIIHKYQSAALARENRAGAYIRKRKGFMVSQAHDADKLRRAGRDAWKAKARGLFDFEEMRIPAAEIDRFLDSVYYSTSTGIRLTTEAAPIEKAFKGPGNLAKKESAHRVILFKDAGAFVEYNREFGRGSLRESLMADMDRSARATALMELFGTNPEAMKDRLVNWGIEKYRGTGKENGFTGGIESIKAQFAEVSGAVNIVGNHPWNRTAAVIGRNTRAVQSMAKLGSSILPALGDPVFGAQTRMFHGRDIFGAWKDALGSITNGMSPKMRKEFGDRLGVGIEGAMGAFQSRFDVQDTLSGKMASGMALYFKLNLLGPWTDATKRGMGIVIARDLGANSTKAFDALDAPFRRLLDIYGIDARQWEVARSAAVTGSDGRVYIMPGDIADAKGAAFTGLSAAQQQALKDKVQENIAALVTNEVNTASPTPGARERAILRRGHAAGSGSGEVLRFMAQFKSFGTAVNTKVLGRQVYGAGQKSLRDGLMNGTAGNMGVANIIAVSTLMGYLVMQAKELAKGREPRDFGADTVVAAALQAGGLGIYGDFLFGETNRYFGGFLETVSGPGIGAAAEGIDLVKRAYTGLLTGDMENLSGDMIRFAKSNTPFANLFYTKDAMDYLIWYQLMEMSNPGYLKRMEQRYKDNNQEYYLPPSSIVARGGGFK